MYFYHITYIASITMINNRKEWYAKHANYGQNTITKGYMYVV